MIKIDLKPEIPALLLFGRVAFFAFPLISLVVMWRFSGWEPGWGIYTLWFLGGYCGLMTLIWPRANLPIYLLMTLLAAPIGYVLSAVVLRLIYYGLFTPIALWFRVIGRDAMNRRLEPTAETYWQDHRDRARPRTPASYFRMH
jgi:hypothetical protein